MRRRFQLFGVSLLMIIAVFAATTPASRSTSASHVMQAGEVRDYCSKGPELSIPDNNVDGVTSSIPITVGDLIQDVDVTLNIDHSFVGNLRVVLSNGATQAVILNRPNNGTGDCVGDDLVQNVANDSALGQSFNQSCNSQFPSLQAYTNNESYQAGDPPSPVLAVFNGSTTAGNWTMKVVDLARNDVGSFVNWCMRFTVIPATPTPIPTVTPIPTRTPTTTPTMTLIPSATPTGTVVPPTVTPIISPSPTKLADKNPILYAPFVVKEHPRLNCQTLEDESLNPNNTSAQAATSLPVCIGQSFTGYHNVPNDQEDIYRIEIPATGNPIPLNVFLNVPNIDLTLILYNSNLQVLDRSTESGIKDEEIDITVVPGTYFVRVYRVDPATTDQPYQLLVTTSN